MPDGEAPNGRSFSIICLASQDWEEALPTNRQQIMARAAARGHRVLFVETHGFLGKHLLQLVRGPRRGSLWRRLFGLERVAPGVDVRKSLNVLPWGQKYALGRQVNAITTLFVLRRLASELPPPVLLWVYDPAAVATGRRLTWPIVYDCVDDYPEQTRGAQRRALMARADDAVARAARLVFTTTPTLLERQRGRNPRTHHVPNAADYEHFSAAADAQTAAQEVSALPRPVIGFSGNFLADKVDFALVGDLARARRDWSFLLVGPVQRDVQAQLDDLRAEPNVIWVGPKPYAELPRYVAAFDVGLIPYLTNAYTRSCFPLKLYEYLAAGKPVVATGLPSLEGMEPDVVLAAGRLEAVVEAVSAALARSADDDRARRMGIAARNTWDGRVERLLELVAAELGTS